MQIVQMPSPNRMPRGGWKPDMIVHHVTEGGFAGAVSWLRNPASRASAHFVVGRGGEVAQLVPLEMAAWCNGTSIGGKYSVYRAKVPLVRKRMTNANLYTVSIEYEGYSYKDRFGGLTEPQFQTAVELCRHIRAEVLRMYGVSIPWDREHVVGHFEIAPREKPNCPGRNFPWGRLMDVLRAEEGGEDVERIKVKFQYRGRPFEADGFVKDGRNYVQARGLLEAMGLKVGWDNATKTVLVEEK